MKNIGILLGVVLIVAAGIWQIALRDQFNQRFPDGWTWEVNTLGTTILADEESGQFPEGTTPEDDPVNITTREVKASTEGLSDGNVKLSDYFLTRDPATNTVTWEFTFEATVDAKTGQYVDEAYADDYFLFPQNVEKTSYNVRNTSYQGVPVEFVAEEEISGINTYLFAYTGNMENATAYAGWIEPEAGQSIICYDFELQYWVEPKTGEVVKYREWCPGDYLVDDATGERLRGLQRWTGETTGDDLVRRVDEVQSQLTRYNFMNLYLPLLLLLAGLVLLGAGLVAQFMNRPTQASA